LIPVLPIDTPLKLLNTAFCKRIACFGNWEPLERNEFEAGKAVLVYCEIENFQSQRDGGGGFRTRLKSTMEIFDDQGQLVVRIPFEPADDFCKRLRRDYYLTYEFSIPQRCGRGPHTLKLTVEDESSHESASSTLEFTVK
jgi:hypothetical protein